MSFWIKKDKVARCFKRALTSYDDHAIVQKMVDDELVDLLSELPDVAYDRVLEIGCCTGMMTKSLYDRFDIATLYINDLVPEFQQTVLARLKEKKNTRIIPVFGDIEQQTIPAELDLVVSSATFQWIEDLEKLFTRLSQSMSANGHLAFTMFSPGTLQEFRQLTNIGLHYYGEDRLTNILKSHFEIKFLRNRKDVLYFPTPKEVLQHFKATGVGGVSEYRWTAGKMNQFIQEYTKRFGTSKGVPVSYASTLVIATKK